MALAAFLIANPYAVLNWDAFTNGLTHQSDASGDAAGKLGLTQDNGFAYYLWSFGWGLGWVPLRVRRRRRRAAVVRRALAWSG